MNLTIDENLGILQETVQRFASQQLTTEGLTQGFTAAEKEQLFGGLTELGVFHVTLSEDQGGFGFGPLALPLILESIGAANPSLAAYLAFHLALADPASPETPCAVGVTPTSGQTARLFSFLDAPESTRILTGPTIAAPVATTVTAKASPDALGLSGLHHTTCDLDGAPSSPVDNSALSSLMTALAATAVGLSQGALREGLAYAAEREQFGKALNRFQAIQFKLADMEAHRLSAQWLTYRAATDSTLAAAALSRATESAAFIADEALQIHGGYGYTKEYPVETFFRDAQELRRIAADTLALHWSL